MPQAADPPSEALPLTISTLFGHHDAHPVVLDLVLLRQFGPEWLGWEPETVWSEVERAFGEVNRRAGWRVTVSEHNRSKIQALRTLHTVNTFWNTWEVFVPVVLSLNNIVPRFDILHKPSLAQMMAGVDITNILRPHSFSGDVAPFVAACVLDDGVCWLPEPLGFANDAINPRLYQCRECGNQGEVGDDGLCDVCVSRFDSIRNLDFKADPVRVSRGHGKDLVVGYRYAWQPVRDRYASLASKDRGELDLRETSTDVQVAKLLVATDYMNLRRQQMLDQKERLGEWAVLQ